MNPWDRQPAETPKIYGYFVEYRDAGSGRRLADVAQNNGVTPTYIRGLASRHAWRERVTEWEDELNLAADELAGPELAGQRAELHHRATQLTHLAIDKAETILSRIGDDPDIEVSAAEVSLIKAVITAYSRLVAPDESTGAVMPEPDRRDARLQALMAKRALTHDAG